MMTDVRPIEILLVEDDHGDELLTREVFEHNKIKNNLHVARDGEEGLNFSWARFVPFKTWWEETIFTSISGERFSRASLVLSIRNQDGGSHYDGTLNNPTYLEFKAFDAIKAFQIAGLPAPIDHAGNPIESLPNAHTAMIRQIAWEVGYSLDLAVKEKGSLSMVF